MRIFLPPGAERTARRYFLPFLALIHLSGFHLFRAGIVLPAHGGKWILSAMVAAGVLLLRETIPSRRKDRFPDMRSITAWAAAALLELHAQFPALSESRIIPAILFPFFAFALDPKPALVYGFAAFAWLSWVPGTDPGIDRVSVSILAMAVLGMGAGFSVRRIAGRRGGEAAGGAPNVSREGALLRPWEDPGRKPEGVFDAPPERRDLLRSHERKTIEGIGRVLEGILPASGADLVMFVARSEEPGRPFQAGPSARRGGGGEVAGTSIPDSFLPLREAMFFKRPFFQVGKESAEVRLPWIENGNDPSGVAAVPILNEGTVEGAILGFRFGTGDWSEPVVPLLETGAFVIAREIAEGRERYRSERTLAARAGYHRFFHRVAELAERGGTTDFGEFASPRQEIYRVTAEETMALLRADRVLLVEADDRGTRGRIVREEKCPGMLIDPAAAATAGPWVRLDGTYTEWVLEKGMHRIFSGGVRATGRHPVLPEPWTREEEEEFLLVPVSGTGGFRGVLICASGAGRNYHGQDVEAAREILRIMRMGISHSVTIEMLEQRATTDGLTGLLNRKTFHTRLSAVLTRLDGRYPCALIMLDIDHFKKINDTYGHPAGDEVLKNVAGIIRKTIRKIDMAGRFGGEEFVLYLHHADRNRAGNVAERLRMIIEKARYVFQGKETGVTASLGVACYPSDGGTAQELVARADEALYRSKQGGRNRITFA